MHNADVQAIFHNVYKLPQSRNKPAAEHTHNAPKARNVINLIY